MATKDPDTEAKPSGFRVTDRRRVRLEEADGEINEGNLEEASGHTVGQDEVVESRGIHDPVEGPSREQQERAAAAAEAAAGPDHRRAAPPMDFVTFILSLGSSAMVHLGETPHPESGRPEPNLVMAKQTIDMLAMLEEKTRGNLSRDEGEYLRALLYDLRLRFVDATRREARSEQR